MLNTGFDNEISRPIRMMHNDSYSDKDVLRMRKGAHLPPAAGLQYICHTVSACENDNTSSSYVRERQTILPPGVGAHLA